MTSLNNALKLLKQFTLVTPVLGVSELAARLDLNKATVFNMLSRPLKKCSSNAPGSWISKKRIAQTGLRSDWSGHFGLFAGRFARSGRTYPMVHA